MLLREIKKTIHVRGITAVEAVFGVTIAALILIFVSHAIIRFISVSGDVVQKTQALYLAEDGLELIRFVRDEDWANISGLATGTPYYLEITGSTVLVTTTPEVIEGFARSFVIDNVYRDGNDDIISSTTPGSTPDTSSKYINTTVLWGTPTSTVDLVSILGNIES